MDEWMDGRNTYIYRYKVDCTNQLKKKNDEREREFDMLNGTVINNTICR